MLLCSGQFTVFVTSGPFATCDENILSYTPLDDLLNTVETEAPDVLIMVILKTPFCVIALPWYFSKTDNRWQKIGTTAVFLSFKLVCMLSNALVALFNMLELRNNSRQVPRSFEISQKVVTLTSATKQVFHLNKLFNAFRKRGHYIFTKICHFVFSIEMFNCPYCFSLDHLWTANNQRSR